MTNLDVKSVDIDSVQCPETDEEEPLYCKTFIVNATIKEDAAQKLPDSFQFKLGAWAVQDRAGNGMVTDFSKTFVFGTLLLK